MQTWKISLLHRLKKKNQSKVFVFLSAIENLHDDLMKFQFALYD